MSPRINFVGLLFINPKTGWYAVFLYINIFN